MLLATAVAAWLAAVIVGAALVLVALVGKRCMAGCRASRRCSCARRTRRQGADRSSHSGAPAAGEDEREAGYRRRQGERAKVISQQHMSNQPDTAEEPEQLRQEIDETRA